MLSLLECFELFTSSFYALLLKTEPIDCESKDGFLIALINSMPQADPDPELSLGN
jgi:hypothetical protein